MSKEEFLKIQTCVLKVNIHCDGCKQKVKKILQKIDGVYTTNIDSEQGKVTVSGNVDPATLIKKLTKNGKHAEIWGVSKANNNNQNQMNNQFKNLQIDSGRKGGQNKGQAPKGGGNNQSKGGLQAQNPQFQQQLQQLQHMQQLKGLQDLKTAPQFMKDLKGANNNKDQNQKSVKFNLPEDEGFSDDDFDDDDDDFDDEDYEDFDDEVDDFPVVNNKMNPPVLGYGHGGAQTGNIMMNNIMNGQHPQFMKGGGNNGGNGGENGKKGGGGGGNMPVQMNIGGGNQNQGGANGGKKGGNGNNNGGNQNQGGGKGGKNGGGQPNDGKNGGGGQNKNGGVGGGGAGAMNGNNSMGNGAKKGGAMNDGPHGMPNMMPVSAGGHVGPLGTNMPMGQMGNLPMGQMKNLAAVQGLPASTMAGGGGAGAGYFPAATPEHMTANYQQQLAAMMMNQQRANGNERFQPMMYARPPPAVNYMPPYPPYPYHYAPPHGERTDQYTMFSDENTSSCNVM